MKRKYINLTFILILLSVMLSFDNVSAQNMEPAPVDIKSSGIIELESDKPVGGWSPMEVRRAEEDVVIEKPQVYSFRRAFNSSVDDVFAKGVGTNGYNALSKDAQKTFYTKINEAAISFMESTNDLQTTRINYRDGVVDEYVVAKIDFNTLGLNDNDAIQTLYAYDYDHPAYYWISNKCVIYGDSICLLTEKEYASVSERKSINNKIINGVKNYAAKTKKTDEVFEKIAIIHDCIIRDIDYAYQEDGNTPVSDRWAHSVQGVFDSNYYRAVCEGYSEAFSLMMNYLDIPNYYIVGKTDNGGSHAWNAVSDDGGTTFMYMDLTWDDVLGDGKFFYKYFDMPSSDFESEHIANKSSNAGHDWLYDLSGEFTNDFEHTYYYRAGFYCSTSDDCKVFAQYTRTKAYRFGTIFSYMTDDMMITSKLASEFGLGSQYSYYTISYKNKNYYVVFVSTVKDVDLSDAEIVLANNKFAYTGEEIKPEVTSVVLNGVKLIPNDNYTISYNNNVEVGKNTASVIIKGAGHFNGQCSKTFSIVYTIKEENVKLSATEFTYDGSIKKPEVTVQINNKTLVEDTNYTVAFSDNTTDAGTVTVTVKGKGEYEGSATKSYKIEPASISDYTVSIENGTWTYDGAPKEPEVLSLKNGDAVIASDNYIVTYDNNVNAGNDARVIITGCGNYKDEIADNYFTIAPKEITVTGIKAKNKVYDGNADTTLDYAGVDLSGCGIIEDDKVSVEAEGSFTDSDAGTDKKVSISNIKLSGEDANNYKLSSSGQQDETSADINPKSVTITALDQAVYVNADIDQSANFAVLKGALENHELFGVEFVSSGTDTITDSGSITPCNAVIKNGNNNVTANYDITYIDGNLTVVKKEAVITYKWSYDGKECFAKAVYPLGEFVEENATVSGEVFKKPTCKDKGVTTYTASFTNELFTTQTNDVSDIDVLTTHTPASAVKENEVLKTCTKDGSYDEVIYCSVCDAELDRNTVVVKATGHDYKAVAGSAKSAACTEPGKEVNKKCTVCGDVIEGNVINAFGHDWGDWNVITPATETTEGVKERVCKHDPTHKETGTIDKIVTTTEPTGDDPQSTEPTPSSGEGADPSTGEGSVTTPEETIAPTTGEGNGTTAEESSGSTTEGERGNTEQTTDIGTGETVVSTTEGKTDTSVETKTSSTEKTNNSNGTFNIINSESGEKVLEYKSSSEQTAKTVIIPETQTINGVTYEVTSIADGAFVNCSSLTKVIIPAKVTHIKKNAFRNNKKLKTVIIKSKKLKSIGKNAFKNINKKATIYVPKKLTKKQFAKYKKMLKKAGIAKTVKIKKK